jgi:hypothetical protein
MLVQTVGLSQPRGLSSFSIDVSAFVDSGTDEIVIVRRKTDA